MNYLEESISFLERHGVQDAENSALSLLSLVLNRPALSLKLNPPLVLSQEEEMKFESLLVRRATRYPLQYLMNTMPFRDAVLGIGPGCLIPRPETELLVEVVLQQLNNPSEPLWILEIGTGSGNISISLAMEKPSWSFAATDLSDEALEYARKNSDLNHTSSQINFKKADLWNGIDELFDVVISNPPYLRTIELLNGQAELSFEPAVALDGGEDGLRFYKRILKTIKTALKPEGMIFFEIGRDQARDISNLMKWEFENIEVFKDYGGCERFISGRLIGRELSNRFSSQLLGKNYHG